MCANTSTLAATFAAAIRILRDGGSVEGATRAALINLGAIAYYPAVFRYGLVREMDALVDAHSDRWGDDVDPEGDGADYAARFLVDALDEGATIRDHLDTLCAEERAWDTRMGAESRRAAPLPLAVPSILGAIRRSA